MIGTLLFTMFVGVLPSDIILLLFTGVVYLLLTAAADILTGFAGLLLT